jgi:hypothetical protein
MTKIKDSQVVNDFSRGGDSIGINVNELSTETQDKMKKVGVSKGDLENIAGSDGRISGKKEFKQLYKAIDTFDKNGKAGSIQTRDAKNAPTPSGEFYDAMKSEVDRNVAKANMQGIIHVGTRKASKKEADAMQSVNSKHGGVQRIESYKSEGVVEYNKTKHDLKTTAGLESYRKAITKGPDAMDEAQAKKFVEFLGDKNIEGKFRDELAQLGTTLHQVGKGKIPANRLVISGHGMPGGMIMDDNFDGYTLKDVKNLAQIFPEGSKKIEHVAIAACFCGKGKENFQDMRDGFPNLKSTFAYKEFSPKAGEGAETHLKKWAKMTDGADPSGVDPFIAKTATWNSVDGYKGLSDRRIDEVVQSVNNKKVAYDAYQPGGTKKPVPQGKHDPALDAYYNDLGELTTHDDFKFTFGKDEQKRYNEHLNEVLNLRRTIQSSPTLARNAQ